MRSIFSSSLYHCSRLSNNFRTVAQIFNIGINNAKCLDANVCIGAISKKFYADVQPGYVQIGQQVRELCIVRDKLHLEKFLLSRQEINSILELLCVD